MKSIRDVLFELKLDRSFAVAVGKGWKDSMEAYPGTLPAFLEKEFYTEHLTRIGVAEIVPLMDDLADKVRRSPELCLLAWHAHHYLCYSPEPSFKEWPEFDQIFGENCAIFYLLIGLSSIPVFSRVYHDMGIPESYALEAAKWLGGTVEIYKSGHSGSPGHNRSQLYWMRNYIDGKLFRIGRFEFMEQGFPESFKMSAYKNRKNGQILALMADGIACSVDGLVLYPDQEPEDAAFITSFTRDETAVSGNPVSPAGLIIKRTVRLPLTEWECVLSSGDFTLEIHIPGGGKMDVQACGDSLKEALEFYKTYFPEKQVKAFVCGSWILNHDLELIMPESNLAKFMRQVYLFPMASTGRDGLFFIFGRDYGDISEYPRDNSVRRAMMSIFDEGKRLRTGGMFYLPEHLDKFGTEYYRRYWKLPGNANNQSSLENTAAFIFRKSLPLIS